MGYDWAPSDDSVEEGTASLRFPLHFSDDDYDVDGHPLSWPGVSRDAIAEERYQCEVRAQREKKYLLALKQAVTVAKHRDVTFFSPRHCELFVDGLFRELNGRLPYLPEWRLNARVAGGLWVMQQAKLDETLARIGDNVMAAIYPQNDGPRAA